jgi:hypothetical protein
MYCYWMHTKPEVASESYDGNNCYCVISWPLAFHIIVSGCY